MISTIISSFCKPVARLIGENRAPPQGVKRKLSSSSPPSAKRIKENWTNKERIFLEKLSNPAGTLVFFKRDLDLEVTIFLVEAQKENKINCVFSTDNTPLPAKRDVPQLGILLEKNPSNRDIREFIKRMKFNACLIFTTKREQINRWNAQPLWEPIFKNVEMMTDFSETTLPDTTTPSCLEENPSLMTMKMVIPEISHVPNSHIDTRTVEETNPNHVEENTMKDTNTQKDG